MNINQIKEEQAENTTTVFNSKHCSYAVADSYNDYRWIFHRKLCW